MAVNDMSPAQRPREGNGTANRVNQPGCGWSDLVLAPFAISDGTCGHCRNGITTSCVQGSYWGAPDRADVLADGAQAEQVRVPLADGTLVRVDAPVAEELVPDLLALSDVMGTGHHAAVSAGVQPGATVVVVATARSGCAPCWRRPAWALAG